MSFLKPYSAAAHTVQRKESFCLWWDAQEEEDIFLEGVRSHGRDAKLIARDMRTRTIGDVKKYYQKHKKCAPFSIDRPYDSSAYLGLAPFPSSRVLQIT